MSKQYFFGSISFAADLRVSLYAFIETIIQNKTCKGEEKSVASIWLCVFVMVFVLRCKIKSALKLCQQQICMKLLKRTMAWRSLGKDNADLIFQLGGNLINLKKNCQN